MKNNYSQHFSRLSKSIKKLIILLTILVGIKFLYSYSYQNNNTTYSINNIPNTSLEPLKDTIININSANYKELQSIGLNQQQAATILKYIKKGGYFNSKNDLLKIYCISQETYTNIESKIFCIPRRKKQYVKNKKEFTKSNTHKFQKNYTYQIQTFELNSCDTTQLKTIYGIGSKKANRIINYRNKLGGFVSYKQYYEIYSSDTLVCKQLEKHTIIDTFLVKKINVNTCSFSQLVSHPYISYYNAKRIFEYKKIQKEVVEINELKKNNILSEKEYEKVKIYLTTF